MTEYERNLMDFLKGMVNENRLQLIDSILAKRTRYITVVLEDIYQAQNASAVLRTCDCFGIQDIHVIENRNKLEINSEVELGAAQWLNISKYNKEPENSLAAINDLRSKGYRIVATTPHAAEASLYDFDISGGKTALFFGTEVSGLSEIVLNEADELLKIPMYGFTESLNISVSAAIILNALRELLVNNLSDWQLSAIEKEAIRYQWIRNSIRNLHRIEKAYKKGLAHK
jgi:tRNA (guanosine-2'-O-)-methyltransferase